jgi:hypothetical protein
MANGRSVKIPNSWSVPRCIHLLRFLDCDCTGPPISEPDQNDPATGRWWKGLS